MAKQYIKFSILILSLPSRIKFLEKLVTKLELQIGSRTDVEILSLMDNKSYNVSEKRNALLSLARGTHLAWIDDDDDISENYISEILNAIEKNPNVDVISFNQQCYLNGIEARVFAKMGNPHQEVIYDSNIKRYRDTLRPPYHWCVWKTSLAKSETFRFGAFVQGSHIGEDIDWLNRLYPKVTNSVYLGDKFLHIYKYSKEISESR